MDEAYYVPLDVLSKLVIPTMSEQNKAMVGVSTPRASGDEGPSSHFMKQLLTSTLNGIRCVEVVRMSRVCDACAANSRLECVHVRNKPPTWKPKNRQKLMGAMLGKKAFNAEVAGAEAIDTRCVFEKLLVDGLRDRPLYNLTANVGPAVFIGIDPCSGGSGSEFTAIAMLAGDQSLVVCHPSRTRPAPSPRSRACAA